MKRTIYKVCASGKGSSRLTRNYRGTYLERGHRCGGVKTFSGRQIYYVQD